MITQETIEIDGRELVKTVSDTYMLRQIETGLIYGPEVIDVPDRYTYEETDQEIPEYIKDPDGYAKRMEEEHNKKEGN